MKRERRYYYRIWHVNSPGWMSVRRHAETHRECADAVFDRKPLDTLLPGPDQQMGFDEPMLDASGPKLLLGFLLWAHEHL